MIVLVDVDGVVCDIHTAWLARYNRDFNDNLTPQDMTEWEFSKFVKPEARKRFNEYLNEDLYTDETPMVGGARVALNRLRQAGDGIVFVSAMVSPGMYDEKVAWLRRNELLTPNRGFIGVLNNAPKWLIRGDVLIDDRADTVRDFIAHGGIGVLFSQPHNRNEYTPGARMESWEEIEEDGIMGFLKRKVLGVAA